MTDETKKTKTVETKNKKMVVVEFLKPMSLPEHCSYRKGEKAGFPEKVAAQIVDQKFGKIVK